MLSGNEGGEVPDITDALVAVASGGLISVWHCLQYYWEGWEQMAAYGCLWTYLIISAL